MSQISTEKDDNISVAAASFVQSLEIGAKMNEVVQMFSTQNEEHRKEMAQLKDGFAKEMAQLKDGFAQMLSAQSEQQKEMAQYKAQIHSLEQKLKEAETEKNKSEGVIQQLKKMDGIGQQAIGSNSNKVKILANPKGIVWDGSKSTASISECGLKVTDDPFGYIVFAIATEGYTISGEHCRKENSLFPGTIVYYYEVTITSCFEYSSVGFTDGSKTACFPIGDSPNSYGIVAYGDNIDSLLLSGKEHKLECLTGVIANGDVLGCGLLLNSKNELAVFFTLNGVLLGKQMPINPTVDRLYPTMFIRYASVEANFGGNIVAKPFKFDTDKGPGLIFE